MSQGSLCRNTIGVRGREWALSRLNRGGYVLIKQLRLWIGGNIFRGIVEVKLMIHIRGINHIINSLFPKSLLNR